MSKSFYTYIYRDPSRDNEPIYVGKGCGKRAWKHLSNTNMHPFTQRLQYMTKNNVEPQIELIDALDESHALFMESCLIQVIGRKDLGKGPLLNLTDGGDGGSAGRICSVETRNKMSRRICSVETRNKMSTSFKGRKHSEETKAKMRLAKVGIPLSEKHKENLAKNSARFNKNKVMASEQKAKISSTLTGKTLSLEHKANISAGLKKKALCKHL